MAQSLVVVADRLFFRADDGVLGSELWVLQLGAGGQALAVAYGQSACPGTGGLLPRIASRGLPVLGNAAFAIDVTDARSLSPALVALGLAPAANSFGSCRLLVAQPFVCLPAVVTDAAGFARTPVPIPANPVHTGLQMFAQYAVFDPAGRLLQGLSLSDGLRLQLGL